MKVGKKTFFIELGTELVAPQNINALLQPPGKGSGTMARLVSSGDNWYYWPKKPRERGFIIFLPADTQPGDKLRIVVANNTCAEADLAFRPPKVSPPRFKKRKK